ncbi:hypothetical protein [Streptomonospora sp. PA3]|uniref:hypothetical protein n=1 Tax=Streptomonospora sp. PA3 TaxID=2607326 RepID=UPI0012DFE4AD|nr:hypothetical protein [Streptomonospora sp. PA3]
MAAQPPHPPSDDRGPRGHGPPGGDCFPGPPGGPLPPRPGGAGAPGPWSGLPPGGPGAGSERAGRLRRRLIGGAAAGVLAIGVVAGFVWAALDEGPPYADLAGCEELLPAGVIDSAPEIAGPLIGDAELTGGETFDSRIIEQAECWTPAEGGSSGMMAVSIRRYAPGTEEADYAPVRRALERERGDLAGGVETGASARRVEAYYGSVVADVEVRPLPVGEHGFAISYADADPEDALGVWGGVSSWAVAQFHERNVIVQVVYHGTAAMTPEEKLEAAAELARLIERRVAETARTV